MNAIDCIKTRRSVRVFEDKAVSAEKIALFGYKKSLKGKRIAIPGFTNKLTAFAPRFFTRKFVATVSAGTLKKGG